MKEILGELWSYYGKPENEICITTNGTLKTNGCGVMGRGCAAEAKARIPEIDRVLGDAIRQNGNHFQLLVPSIWAFPVKHNWWEQASLELIAHSAEDLAAQAALAHPEIKFILPRPGCGNGRLTWAEVRPIMEQLPDNVWIISK